MKEMKEKIQMKILITIVLAMNKIQMKMKEKN